MQKDKVIKTVKDVGDVAMYIGSASIVRPFVSKKNVQLNGPLQLCAYGAGAVISFGLGSWTSNWFNKIVDTVVDFVEDISEDDDT